MNEQVLVIIVSSIFSGIGGTFGWLIGRRKKDAETRLLETDVLTGIKNFYQEIIEDNQKTLLYYKEQIGELQKKVEGQDKKIRELSEMVNQSSVFLCYRSSCPYRLFSKQTLSKEDIKKDNESIQKFLKDYDENN